jgi:hypothetical protein
MRTQRRLADADEARRRKMRTARILAGLILGVLGIVFIPSIALTVMGLFVYLE